MRMRPESGSSKRTASWASVDLPDPEAPTMQVHRPALALTLAPRTAWVAVLG